MSAQSILFFLGISLLLTHQAQSQVIKHTKPSATLTEVRYHPGPYEPVSIALYQTIVRMDSLYFDTYNHSKLQAMDSLTSENLEFYHDKNGLCNSKKELLAAIQKNIFGKVTRELAKGSIEVYPIHGFGAVEIGYHRFHNNAEQGGAISPFSKFIIIWQLQNQHWLVYRVVSLH